MLGPMEAREGAILCNEHLFGNFVCIRMYCDAFTFVFLRRIRTDVRYNTYEIRTDSGFRELTKYVRIRTNTYAIRTRYVRIRTEYVRIGTQYVQNTYEYNCVRIVLGSVRISVRIAYPGV